MRLVEDDRGIGQCTSAHESQRRDLDFAGLQRAFDDARVHQVVQRVVDRAQVRVDFFTEVAGQEAEPLAGFDRGPGQDDAIDFLALEQLRGLRHREPGLAGAGGSDAEHQLVLLQRADVGILCGGARPHRALAQVDGFERRFRRFGIEFEQRALGDHGADRAFDLTLREVMALSRLGVQRLQHAPRRIAAVAGSGDADVVAPGIHHYVEPAFDQRQILSVGADQRRRRAVVIEVDDDLGLGRGLQVAVEFAAGGERRRIRCTFWARVQAPTVVCKGVIEESAR